MTVWYAGAYALAYQSSIQNNKYQVSHKYSYFFWWWAHIRPKYIEINKYTEKICAPSWFHLQAITRDVQSTKHKIREKALSCVGLRNPNRPHRILRNSPSAQPLLLLMFVYMYIVIARSLLYIVFEMFLDTYATEERTASFLGMCYVFLLSSRPSWKFCLSLQLGWIIFSWQRTSRCVWSTLQNKFNMYPAWHNYMFILILFLLLATSFGPKRSASGQYLQKKNT